jgi:FixJ family two-component response regulator
VRCRIPARKPITRLSAREHEVLALMAEGRSNAAIAQRLFVTEKRSASTRPGFSPSSLASSGDDNRRVLAVLAYLNS